MRVKAPNHAPEPEARRSATVSHAAHSPSPAGQGDGETPECLSNAEKSNATSIDTTGNNRLRLEMAG